MSPLIRYGLATLVGLGLAAELVVLNLADWAIRERRADALHVAAGFSPHAAAYAAEAALAARRPVAAERLARRALEGAPLSARALRVYGLSLEARDDLAGAAAVMATAGGLGWRDTPTQVWLMDAYARQGDMGAALERADALLRRGQFKEQVRALFVHAAFDPNARAVVAQRLAAGPVWRPYFFEAGRSLPTKWFDGYSLFLDHVAESGDQVTPAEVEPFVDKLFQARNYARARETWRRFAAARLAERGNAVLDGGFETSSLPSQAADAQHVSPFEWQFPQAPGTETALGEPPGREGERALYVASAGNIRAEMASQALALAPGIYTLSIDTFAVPGTELKGFSWRVECLPEGQPLDLKNPTRSPEELSFRFEVPQDGCPGQRLVLVAQSDYTAASSFWFDNVVINPVADL